MRTQISLPRLSFQIAAPVFIIIAALLWSLDAIVRSELRSLPALFVVTLEHALGLIIFLPFLWRLRKNWADSSRATKVSLITTSLLSGLLGTFFYTTALAQIHYVPFSVVVLLQQLQPVFVLILSAILLRERLNRRIILLAVFALVGAYMLNFPNLVPDFSSAPGQIQILAGLLALLAAFAWGSGTIFSKFALRELDYRFATGLRFAITTFAGLLACIVLGQTVPLQTINSAQWGQLLLIVCTSGAVALFIYYRGLRDTSAQVSTFAELVWPLSAFTLDIMRGAIYTNTQIIGAALLLLAIVRITRSNKPAALVTTTTQNDQ